MARLWHRGAASLLVLSVFMWLWGLAPSVAAPPGGGGTTTPYSIIELPILVSGGGAISDPNAGIVTVVGNGNEFGYVAAAYVQVNTSTRKIVASGLLPEPIIGPNEPDYGSNANDVNFSGVIVGQADVVDYLTDPNTEDPGTIPTIPTSRGVPVRWVPTNGSYGQPLFLPLPEVTLPERAWGSVTAINDSGVMVGKVWVVREELDEDPNNSNKLIWTWIVTDEYPVLWDGDGETCVKLSDLIASGSGWTLTNATDINNNGLIVGSGMLGGVERGYVLDSGTGDITEVPLASGATTNEAWKINDVGEVIGRANDNIVGGGTFPQGGWGFFWDGLATTATLLPSARTGAAYVRGLNNNAQLVGDSWLADDQVINDPNDSGEMTLWLPRSSGGFSATKLGTQIPTKPVWYLRFGFDINDSRWMLGHGRKFVKGQYTWMGVLVVPNS